MNDGLPLCHGNGDGTTLDDYEYNNNIDVTTCHDDYDPRPHSGHETKLSSFFSTCLSSALGSSLVSTHFFFPHIIITL
jgi:hypothetical protein